MPWGMEFDFPQFGGEFSPAPQQDFQFPVQDFRQQTFAQGMNGNPYASLFGGGNTPAISRYQEYLGNTPTRESYQPGTMGKILAAIAGLGAGIKDPAAGIQTSLGIMDIPYQRALEQYKIEEPGLRQAASIEERQLNDKNAALKQFYDQDRLRTEQQMKQQQFDREMQLKNAELEQRKAEALARAKDAEETRRIQESFNNQRTALDAQYNQFRMLDAFNPMSIILQQLKSQGGQDQAPNAAFTKLQIEQRLMSDPRLASAFREGGFDPSNLSPEQTAAYQQILRELGIYR